MAPKLMLMSGSERVENITGARIFNMTTKPHNCEGNREDRVITVTQPGHREPPHVSIEEAMTPDMPCTGPHHTQVIYALPLVVLRRRVDRPDSTPAIDCPCWRLRFGALG